MAGAAAQLVPVSVLPASLVCVSVQRRFPPINFIYGHFHNSIRAELSLLADRVRSLEVPNEGVEEMLADLRQRYKFLEQVYKYHSNVEDEVLYPALDSKVRNVTLAYSIEHQDEEILFEQLNQLITRALDEPEAARKGTIRTLICKVEEIHTTLRKHLAKEEEQLLPLLLQHFNFAEQAELVAQFLYSIPLETVERVLSQLKPRIPRDEQEQLLVEIRNVIPDNLLSQLLMTWLQPAGDTMTGESSSEEAGVAAAAPPRPPPHGGHSAAVAATAVAPASGPASAAFPAPAPVFACCGNPEACMRVPRLRPTGAAAAAEPTAAAGTPPAGGVGAAAGGGGCCSGGRAPLQDIIHFHRSICSSLADFAREARALQLGRDITASQLSSLLDRHRFLRSVYVFHSISEEEVLFPEVQRLSAAAAATTSHGSAGAACLASGLASNGHSHAVAGGAAGGVGGPVGRVAAQQCERDHQAELSSFEDLGRLLADVRAFARRGRKEVASMLEKLCCSAEAVHASIEHHMQREEMDVFPLLEGHLCEAQQRVLVYRTIRAMPLRLLERVMPWVVGRLDNAAAAALLTNIRLGAPASDQALVELLSRWARRGRRGITPLASAAAAAGAGAVGVGPGPGPAAVVPDPSRSSVTGFSHGAADLNGPMGHSASRMGSGCLPAGAGGAVVAAAGGVSAPVVVAAEVGGGVVGGAAGSEQRADVDVHGGGGDGGGGGGLGASTFGPRFLRDSMPYSTSCCGGGCYIATAVDEDGADSKRRRVSNADASATAAAAAAPSGDRDVFARRSNVAGDACCQAGEECMMVAGASAGGVAPVYGGILYPLPERESYLDGIEEDGDMDEQELSTAPRALLRSRSGGSPDDCTTALAAGGLAGGGGVSRGGSPGAEAAGSGGPVAEPGSGASGAATRDGVPVGGPAAGNPHACGCNSDPAGAGPGSGSGVVVGGGGGGGGSRNGSGGGDGGGSGGGYNPIDHIFQFHKALRQELKQLEADAMTLEQTVLARVRHQQHHAGQQHPLHQVQSQHQRAAGQPSQEQPQLHVQAAPKGTGEVDGRTDADAGAHATEESGCPPQGTSPQHVRTPAMTEAGAVGGADSSSGGGDGGGCGGAGGVGAGCYGTHGRGGLLPIVQNFHGRFQFLQGIYRAHSKAEDEIVFPALESKQALRNVSHAYTLDHRQEEQLFADLEQAIDNLRTVDLTALDSEEQLSRQVMGVRRMCAAIRASLETHIRSEESELWPLFTEHFSREEQQYLVGVIIGRTGAQVLQALLPWVSETFSAEERDAMMDSLRAATRNTMFDQWLEAVQAGSGGAAGPAGAGGVSATGADTGRFSRRSSSQGAVAEQGLAQEGQQHHHQQQHQHQPQARGSSVCMHTDSQPLQQVAEYLAGGGGPGGSAVSDNTSFRPGWEDIFRMNQQQLEAAIHRVSNDSSLEPERKAYLMQNIMVSKYIVAQQRRMVANDARRGQQGGGGGSSGSTSCSSCGSGSLSSATALPQLPQPPPQQQQQQPALNAPPGFRALAASVMMAPPGPGTAAATAAGSGNGSSTGMAPNRAPRQTFHNPVTGVLGCKHYQRKCQLVAPCCNQLFTCRLCHDEACDHRMDRYAVSEMRCMLCDTRQPVAGSCRACGAAMARYVCDICHLFDDEPGKDIYHCPFCNVCRRGRGLGVDFFHCMNCNACMSLSLFSSHKCREKCIEGNCPVCHEALFDSSQPIKELPCGHFMHSTCFLTYTRYNYTCPLCCKSVGDMSVYFQMLDSLLASERLPPEYAGRMQQVLCNDCGKMGFAPFHFVYHSCPHCRSYNTRVL